MSTSLKAIMQHKERELRAELERLKQMGEQHRTNRDTIAALLEKADARKSSHPEERVRWDQVIENLEFCLDETKARLASCEASILRIERRLKGLLEEGVSVSGVYAPEIFLFEEPMERPFVPGDTLAVAKRILEMPSDEMGRLTLDAVSDLQSRIAEENAAAAAHDSGQMAGPVLPEESSAALPQEPRKQQMLRGAIEKIQKNRIAMLTEEEKRLIIASHELLISKCDDTPKGRRLRRILGAAVNILVSRRQFPAQRAESNRIP